MTFLASKKSSFLLMAIFVLGASNIVLCPCCGAESDLSRKSYELVEHATANGSIDSYSEILGNYRKYLSRKIKRCWFPPKDGGGGVVRFVLERDGEVSNLSLCISSGMAAGDESVLKAVRLAQPFKIIPQELPAPLEVELDLHYYGSQLPDYKSPGLILRTREVPSVNCLPDTGFQRRQALLAQARLNFDDCRCEVVYFHTKHK